MRTPPLKRLASLILMALAMAGLPLAPPARAQLGVTWTQEATSDFTTRANTGPSGNGGTETSPISTTSEFGPQADWTDYAGSAYSLQGGFVGETGAGLTQTGNGLQGEVYRNLGTSTQKIVAEWYQANAYESMSVKLRFNPASPAAFGYAFTITGNGGAGAVASYNLVVASHTSYSPGPNGTLTGTITGTGSTTAASGNLPAALVSGAAGTGHWYALAGSVLSTSGTATTATFTLYDEGTTRPVSAAADEAGTVLLTLTDTNDTTANIQTATLAGMAAARGSGMAVSRLTSYVPGGNRINISNPTQPLLANVTLALIGTGTNWTSGAPPVLTASGLPSAALGAVTVLSATTATVPLATGNTVGTLTIADSGTGTSATVNVAAEAVNTATTTAQGVLSATLAAPGGTTGGTAPYTYQLLRDVTALSTTGTAAGAAQTGKGEGVSPTPVADTPGTGFWYYRWRVTDSNGQVGYSQPSFALVTDRVINVLCLGDSKVVGNANSSEGSQWCLPPAINVAGTGYPASSNFPLTISAPAGANGIQAAGYATSNGSGVIVSCTITQRGWGYVTFPTVTLAQTTAGTAASFGGQAGGGWPMHLERMLRTLGGFHTVNVVNGAQGGTDSRLYNPASAGYGIQASGEATAEYVSGQSDLTGWIVDISTGVNGAGTTITKAAYKADLQAAITHYQGLHAALILLDKPDNSVPNSLLTFTATDAVLGFGDACAELAAANPAFVRVGDTQSNAYFSAYQGTTVSGPNLGTNLTAGSVDLLHRNDFGQVDRAAIEARAIGQALGLTPATAATIRRRIN